MPAKRRGFQGPHLRTPLATQARRGFTGLRNKASLREDVRGGYQGPRLLPGKTESYSVRLHRPDVMRRIAEKAFALWTRRGCPHDTHLPDWAEAERSELDRSR